MLIREILRVRDLGGPMKKDLIFLPPDATLAEAAKTLGEKNIGLVIISNKDGSLAGVLSERDVVRAIGKSGHAALDSKVEAFMTKKVHTCRLMDHAHDVVAMMTRTRFRHMPVVENGEIKGLVSSTDIFRYLSENANPEEQALLWSKINRA